MMPESRIVRVDGVPVRYSVAGAGKPLALIHGLAASQAWWSRNVDALAARHTVYLLELPGFGSMRACHREFRLEQAPHWVHSVLTAAGVPRASIVAHSMGGVIALSMAARWPETVDRLVLAAPAVGLPYRSVKTSLAPMFSACMRMSPSFLPTLFLDAARAGPMTVLRAARELFASDGAHELASVRAPTLLIWGERDALVPLSCAEPLRDALRCGPVRVIRGAGHVVMYDAAVEFNSAVLGFLLTSA